MLKPYKLIVLVMVFSMFLTAACARKIARNDEALTPVPPEDSEAVVSLREDDAYHQEERPVVETAAQEPGRVAFIEENIHFKSDSFALSNEARMILMKKADFLRSNPEQRIMIEGHCDERGPAAYNIALGQRRAEAVKAFLVDQGVDEARLNTASFGEARPIATGGDEKSWAQNRRAEFVIN